MCFIASIPWTTVGKALQGFLTLLIAGIAVGVAYQQHVVNRRHYRLALFEKRIALYYSTQAFIALVVGHANPQLAECIQFLRDTRDHEFLFESEIGTFIDEVYKHAINLHTCLEVGSAAKQTEILNWFRNQNGEATKLFLKYIDFRES